MDYATRQAITVTARSQLGVREQPAFSNRQPYGAHYHQDGQPWCGYFVSWVFETAGVPLPSLEPWMPNGFSYCPDAVAYAARAHEQVDPIDALAGDIVLFDWAPGTGDIADHVGIVTAVDGGGLTTIEGNTSPTDAGSQSNGGGVYERHRAFATVRTVWRPSVNLPVEEANAMAAQYLLEPSVAVPGLWCKVRPDGRTLIAWFGQWQVDVLDDQGNPRGVTNTAVGTSILDVAVWLAKPLVGQLWVAQDPKDPGRFVISDNNGDYAVRLEPL